MRASFSERVERGRHSRGSHASARGETFGAFDLRTNDGASLFAFVSSGSDDVPWEHVSVSLRERCPTWAEMCWVKDLFWLPEESVVQFHPPASEYVDGRWSARSRHCLHMWRPLGVELPRPPTIAVGPRTIEEARALGLPVGGAA